MSASSKTVSWHFAASCARGPRWLATAVAGRSVRLLGVASCSLVTPVRPPLFTYHRCSYRLRSQIAKEFMASSSDQQHDDPAAARTWNSSWGCFDPVEDLHRQRREATRGEAGGEGDEGRRPEEDERGRLADRPRDARGSPRSRCRGSPRGGPGGGSSATGSRRAPAIPRGSRRDRSDRLAGGEDHDRQHQQGQRRSTPSMTREPEAERTAGDEGEAEEP